jgi:hypothetical protein
MRPSPTATSNQRGMAGFGMHAGWPARSMPVGARAPSAKNPACDALFIGAKVQNSLAAAHARRVLLESDGELWTRVGAALHRAFKRAGNPFGQSIQSPTGTWAEVQSAGTSTQSARARQRHRRQLEQNRLSDLVAYLSPGPDARTVVWVADGLHAMAAPRQGISRLAADTGHLRRPADAGVDLRIETTVSDRDHGFG